ncbi:unnamed protein product [Pylaiella littoralis]
MVTPTPSPRSPPPPPLPKTRSVGPRFRSSDDEWLSENENEVLDMWHEIEDSIKRRGIVMLDKCRFNHFCTFVMSLTTTHKGRVIE